MKTKQQEVVLYPVSQCITDYDSLARCRYEFESNVLVDPSKLKFYIEVEYPETLKEFLEHHQINKKELLKWLNKNYKK